LPTRRERRDGSPELRQKVSVDAVPRLRLVILRRNASHALKRIDSRQKPGEMLTGKEDGVLAVGKRSQKGRLARNVAKSTSDTDKTTTNVERRITSA
jgi:hypothetical protein